MNHQEAENTKATERYLLREMTDDARPDESGRKLSSV